jgi:septation ring formation regulator EzrA
MTVVIFISGGDRMAQYIPAPLKQLMTERSSLKAQIDKLQNDYAILQDEKQKTIEDFEKRLNELIERRNKLQADWKQFNDAVEAMKQAFQIETEEQVPPEEEQPQ